MQNRRRRCLAVAVGAAVVVLFSGCKPLITVHVKHAGGPGTSLAPDSSMITDAGQVPVEVRNWFPAGTPARYRLRTDDVDLWLPDAPIRDVYSYGDGSTEESYASEEYGYYLFVERGLSADYTSAEVVNDLAKSDDSLQEVTRVSHQASTWHGLQRLDAQYASHRGNDSYQDQFVVLRDGGALLVVEWFGAGVEDYPDQVMTAIAETAEVHFGPEATAPASGQSSEDDLESA